jgi:hypothetical protein
MCVYGSESAVLYTQITRIEIQKNVGIIPWEKFRIHSALVPKKFPYKYNSEFFLRKIGVLLWIFRGINFLGNFWHIHGKIPTYSRKNSDLFSEKFLGILSMGNSSDILFHWRRIFRRVNLGKIPRSVLFQGIFPRKFLVQTKLFAWRVFLRWKIAYSLVDFICLKMCRVSTRELSIQNT